MSFIIPIPLSENQAQAGRHPLGFTFNHSTCKISLLMMRGHHHRIYERYEESSIWVPRGASDSTFSTHYRSLDPDNRTLSSSNFNISTGPDIKKNDNVLKRDKCFLCADIRYPSKFWYHFPSVLLSRTE